MKSVFSLTDWLGVGRMKVRRLWMYMIYVGLLFIYIPTYVIMHVLLKWVLFKKIVQRLLGTNRTPELDVISRKNRVSDVSVTSIDEKIDFLTHRNPVYIRRLTLWTPHELAMMFSGLTKTPLISDEHLAYVILNTVFAHSVTWCAERKMYHLVMAGFEDACLFTGFYWDAREVYVSRDGKKLIIKMYDNSEYSSDATDVLDRANFDQAKLHVQICLSYYAPGLAHNHVHFVFPSTMCVFSKSMLDKDGVLYNLLSPHFRFTEAINQQALRVGKATNNKRSIVDRLFFFWQPFPVTKEEFIEGVAWKCKKYYQEEGDKNPDEQQQVDQLSSDESESSSDEEMEVEQKTQMKNRTHQIFPPRFVTDPKIAKIPYMKFLKAYYMVVRKFVVALEPLIDKDEWNKLATAVTEYVPKYNKVNMIDAITTFVHQVGITHFADHNSYLKYFAWKHGCMAFRYPFEDFRKEKFWEVLLTKRRRKMTLDEVKLRPDWLIRKRDIMRTRCFLNVFVDFIPNPSCSMQLIETKYNFNNKLAQRAAHQFLTNLRKLDGKLKNTPPSIPIKRNDDEKRAVGSQLIVLDDIVRSVCY